MIRLSSLFLALIILLCYGGLCRDSFAISGAPEVKTSRGCHGMSHESKGSETNTALGIINDSGSQDGSCCHEALTNTQPDLNARIDVTTIDRSRLYVASAGKINRNKQLDGSPREHDPPDLQISLSTFLL